MESWKVGEWFCIFIWKLKYKNRSKKKKKDLERDPLLNSIEFYFFYIFYNL